MSVFRTATSQAIRELVEEHGVPGRFGTILTSESVTMLCERVVDLFEFTLELRSRTQGFIGGENKNSQTDSQDDFGMGESKLRPGAEVRLPRKKFALTPEEKQRLMRRP